jgi:hypothetical protein
MDAISLNAVKPGSFLADAKPPVKVENPDAQAVSKVASVRDIESNLNPSSYYGLIDFELIKFRQPRQT